MKPHHTALAALLALAACRADAEGISREQFIRANVALRVVADSAPQVDSARARALRAARVKPAELRAWVAAHQNQPAVLADTWEEIAKQAQAKARGGPPKPPGKSGSTGNFTLPPDVPKPPPAEPATPPSDAMRRIPRPGEAPPPQLPNVAPLPAPPAPNRGRFGPPQGLRRPIKEKRTPRPGAPTPPARLPANATSSEPAPARPDTTR